MPVAIVTLAFKTVVVSHASKRPHLLRVVVTHFIQLSRFLQSGHNYLVAVGINNSVTL